MNPDLNKIQEQIYDLQGQLNLLRNNATIPFEVGEAMKARVLTDVALTTVSPKDKDSEDVTVSESGSSTYAVLGDPDGFMQVTISGTTYYLPYFN